MEVLREAKCVCPVCLRDVPGRLVEEENKIRLERVCPVHGHAAVLLSSNADYYRNLNEYYFDLIRESYPQKDFLVHLTERCQLECPECFDRANESLWSDPPLDVLENFFRARPGRKLDLKGAEPTMRDDLPSIARSAVRHGHRVVLCTNGVRLADFEYAKRLRDSGVGEIQLQLDGFDDAIDLKLRGVPLNATKKQALANLERLELPTGLKCTVEKGVNEDRLSEPLDYALRHPFVRRVFYMGRGALGRFRDGLADRRIMPDELIDKIQEQTGGKINRDDIRVFQKLFFALLFIARLCKCFYNQHYLLIRDGSDYSTFFDVIRKEGLEKKLDDFRQDTRHGARRLLPAVRLFARLIPHFLSWRALRFLTEVISSDLKRRIGFRSSPSAGRGLLLGFVTTCDAWIYDEAVAANCGKGQFSGRSGPCDSGARANIERERAYLEKII